MIEPTLILVGPPAHRQIRQPITWHRLSPLRALTVTYQPAFLATADHASRASVKVPIWLTFSNRAIPALRCGSIARRIRSEWVQSKSSPSVIARPVKFLYSVRPRPPVVFRQPVLDAEDRIAACAQRSGSIDHLAADDVSGDRPS